MPDITIGRVALGSTPDKSVFAHAVEEAIRRSEAADERADEYRRLLGAVYSIIGADLAVYGQPELDREVRDALEMESTSAL
jgi:hypothetical protein